MLARAIQDLGIYTVSLAFSLDQALANLVDRPYAMAIVDAGGLGVPLPLVVDKLRAIRPELRLMGIPDEEDGPDGAQVDIQGLLPKPFFVGELAGLLDEALKRPWGDRADEPAAEISDDDETRLKAILGAVCRDSQALGALLVSDGQILARSGTASAETLDILYLAMSELESSLERVAEVLDEEDGVEQVVLEGKKTRLYLLRVLSGMRLVLMAESATPLGGLRYEARRARREIESLLEDREG